MLPSPRIAIVSDTVDEVNGVAIGLRRLVAAATRAGYAATLIGPAGTSPNNDLPGEVSRVPAAMSASLPFYAEYTWSVPELTRLTMLLRDADIVQIATPGPMGIAALIAGRMLGIPVIAQYHTEVAEYAARMTGLPFLRDLVAPLVGWFYQQADQCLAPSDAVVSRLTSLGVKAERIARVSRGTDLDLFHPARRVRCALDKYGTGHGPVALYVGRLSKEKNLDALAQAWMHVVSELPEAKLLVVGDGPYANRMVGPGIVTTGALFGEELATVMASADVFAFPSETETFGNVVVEAAASGLPVVVATAGASREHVVPGVTGDIVAPSDAAAFAGAIVATLRDPDRRARMGRAARAHAQTYDLSRAVHATWAIYREVLRARLPEAIAS